MKKILITGGAGFIGSHTCLLLLEKGYEVLIVDSFVNSSPRSIDRIRKILDFQAPQFTNNISLIEGDLIDKNFINEIFYTQNKTGKPIDGVIHFAGLKAINESIINPLEYWNINLKSTINLLDAMKLNNCRTIVFSSSAAVYGLSKQKLIDENQELKPINPYGNTKMVIEMILDDLFKSATNEWRIISLRYFNPIGAHPSGLIGECPRGVPNNIFPLLMKVASGNIECLKIYGNDWPTYDGTGIRDYIHVMDLANGHLLALENLISQKPKNLKLNLGTGLETSVLTLIRTFERVNDIKINYEFSRRREGDTAKIVADNSLAKKILNWKSKKSLEDMCIDGWNWQKQNLNGF